MRHVFEMETDLKPQDLWRVLADFDRWPEVDQNIEEMRCLDPPGSGMRFELKPKGGPRLRFTVGAFEPPSRYQDLCHLFLGTMSTFHELLPEGEGTRIRVTITVQGPLRGLWWLLAARKHARGLPAQTERMIERARSLKSNSPWHKSARAENGPFPPSQRCQIRERLQYFCGLAP